MQMYILKRVVAYAIDFGLASLLAGGFSMMVLPLLMDMMNVDVITTLLSTGSMFLSGAIPVLLYGTMSGLLGWTPGKLIMGLRVKQRNGKNIDMAQGILRELVKYLCVSFLMIGSLYALFGLLTTGRPFYDEWLNLDVDDLRPSGLTETQKNWRKFHQQNRR